MLVVPAQAETLTVKMGNTTLETGYYLPAQGENAATDVVVKTEDISSVTDYLSYDAAAQTLTVFGNADLSASVTALNVSGNNADCTDSGDNADGSNGGNKADGSNGGNNADRTDSDDNADGSNGGDNADDTGPQTGISDNFRTWLMIILGGAFVAIMVCGKRKSKTVK